LQLPPLPPSAAAAQLWPSTLAAKAAAARCFTTAAMSTSRAASATAAAADRRSAGGGGSSAAQAAAGGGSRQEQQLADGAEQLPVLDPVTDYEKIKRIGEGTFGIVCECIYARGIRAGALACAVCLFRFRCMHAAPAENKQGRFLLNLCWS